MSTYSELIEGRFSAGRNSIRRFAGFALAANQPSSMPAMAKPAPNYLSDGQYRAEQRVRSACKDAWSRRRKIAIVTLMGSEGQDFTGLRAVDCVKVLIGICGGEWSLIAYRVLPAYGR